MSLFVGYDENNNPERIEFAADLTEGSEVHPLHQTYLTAFDEMDRPEGRFVNDEPKSFVEYNDLGQALSFQDADGDRVYIIHDEFGRQAGRAVQVERPDGEKEWLIERIDRYDDGLVNARVDADGEVYDFDYDELGRRTHIEYPNGTVKTIGYDDDGNVNRIKDQNGTVIDQVFDSLGRLERREVTPIQGEQTVEIYEFDAINRLVTAEANGIEVQRTYDTLSRLLEEDQDGHMIKYEYDPRGVVSDIHYPSDESLHTEFDDDGQIAKVVDGDGDQLIENHFESGQLAERKIGDTLTAEFDYATCSANCLEEIVYRNNDDELVDGVRYHYDVDDSVKRRIEPFYDEQFADSFPTTRAVASTLYGTVLIQCPMRIHSVKSSFCLMALEISRRKRSPMKKAKSSPNSPLILLHSTATSDLETGCSDSTETATGPLKKASMIYQISATHGKRWCRLTRL